VSSSNPWALTIPPNRRFLVIAGSWCPDSNAEERFLTLNFALKTPSTPLRFVSTLFGLVEPTKRRLAVRHAQLVEDRADVASHGYLLDEEPAGDLGCRKAASQKVHDVALASRQFIPVRTVVLAVLTELLDERGEKSPRERHFSFEGGSHGNHQALRVGVLRDMTRGAGTERIQERVLLARRSHHEYSRVGQSGGDGTNGRRRVVRQAEVDEASVGTLAKCGLQSARTVCNLGADHEALFFQGPPHAQARERLWVGDEDATETCLRVGTRHVLIPPSA
jgi:hypothetical protein